MFHQKLESNQYKLALAITGAKRRASAKKLYNNFQNTILTLFPLLRVHITQRILTTFLNSKQNITFFEILFSAVIEWNKIDLNILNSESLNIFEESLLRFTLPSGSTVLNCHNLRGVKLLNRLWLGLIHLCEHKFKYGFQDTLNPICSCGNDIKILTHFLLHCPHYSNERSTFLNTRRNINRNIFDKNHLQITETLLYGDSSLDDKSNTLILNAAIDFLFVTKRF